MSAIKPFLREYGDPGSGPVPVVLLHGLFGSSTNWHSIARRLGESRQVLVPDMRNHGRSPSRAPMTYQAMTDELAGLLDDHGIDRAALVGHSMGGKAAMWMTLTRPERVQSLVVADIAPVAYGHRFDGIVDALRALELDGLEDRRDADARLSARLGDPALRGYLLQNLVKEGQTWRWRIDLAILKASMDQIQGFPEAAGHQFAGPALFIYGTGSDYVSGKQLPAIRTLFPLARLRAVPNAGHWVYADQPDSFLRALEGFLNT
jgi:pimeloyl-ACP methyl ester carboxylesterase